MKCTTRQGNGIYIYMSSCCFQNSSHCIYHTTASGQRIKPKRNKKWYMRSFFCLHLYRETCIGYMDSCSSNGRTPFSLLSFYSCCNFFFCYFYHTVQRLIIEPFNRPKQTWLCFPVFQYPGLCREPTERNQAERYFTFIQQRQIHYLD